MSSLNEFLVAQVDSLLKTADELTVGKKGSRILQTVKLVQKEGLFSPQHLTYISNCILAEQGQNSHRLPLLWIYTAILVKGKDTLEVVVPALSTFKSIVASIVGNAQDVDAFKQILGMRNHLVQTFIEEEFANLDAVLFEKGKTLIPNVTTFEEMITYRKKTKKKLISVSNFYPNVHDVIFLKFDDKKRIAVEYEEAMRSVLKEQGPFGKERIIKAFQLATPFIEARGKGKVEGVEAILGMMQAKGNAETTMGQLWALVLILKNICKIELTQTVDQQVSSMLKSICNFYYQKENKHLQSLVVEEIVSLRQNLGQLFRQFHINSSDPNLKMGADGALRNFVGLYYHVVANASPNKSFEDFYPEQAPVAEEEFAPPNKRIKQDDDVIMVPE